MLQALCEQWDAAHYWWEIHSLSLFEASLLTMSPAAVNSPSLPCVHKPNTLSANGRYE